jgi:protein ImuB
LPSVEVPFITAMQDSNQRVIASADDAARRLKLRSGMTIPHAQSLIPNLQIHDAMPVEDEAALHRLALWCTRYSPLVAVDPPAGIFIDIAGSTHLFKGEAALATGFAAAAGGLAYRSQGCCRRYPRLRLGGGTLRQG